MLDIQGKRVKVPHWIHAGPCVVRLEVDAIIPQSDPTEPCFEPATVRWLDEVHHMAEQGRVDELAKIGEVYVRRSV